MPLFLSLISESSLIKAIRKAVSFGERLDNLASHKCIGYKYLTFLGMSIKLNCQLTLTFLFGMEGAGSVGWPGH